MANLKRLWRWERWEPNLGDNLEQPEGQRFFLEIGSGLTKLELPEILEQTHKEFLLEHDMRRAIDVIKENGADATSQEKALAELEPSHARAAKVLSRCVRMGSEPLFVDGKAIATLSDYLALICDQSLYGTHWNELLGQVIRLNSVQGQQELFYARRSGSVGTTRAQNAAKTASQAVAP